MNNALSLRREILESPFVAVHGTGDCGRETAAMLRGLGANVGCFLDRAPRTDELDGLLVRNLESELPSGAFVVVAIFNFAVDSDAVRMKWEKRGINAVNFVVFYRAFEEELKPRYWLEPLSNRPTEEVQPPDDARELWGDEASRALFDATLTYRMGQSNRALLPAPDLENQYFARDVPGWNAVLARALRFVDCGAFDGDTLRDLAARELQIEAVAAFEPDARNFTKLVQSARAALPETPVLSWPCGVWNRSETLRFAADGASSHLGEAGETAVPCVALDDVLHGFQPNFIKMDIEGAEPQALEGARRLIETHRPALAICVYHRADHLWRIAQMLHSWNCGYRLFLRSYHFNGFETVLYAVPHQ